MTHPSDHHPDDASVLLAPVDPGRPQRVVAIRLLAGIVALLCGVLTWALVTRPTGDSAHHNRDLIDQLACEVQQLGAEPVDGATCPPTPAGSPTPTPTPAPDNTQGLKPVIVTVPGGGTRVIYVRPSGSSGSPAPRSPSSRPHATPTRSASPSPSPTPSCVATVAGVCVRRPGTVGGVLNAKELPGARHPRHQQVHPRY